MTDSQDDDRRRHTRHRIERGAKVRCIREGAAHIGGRTSDISASGVALKDFEAPHGFDPGDDIIVEIEADAGEVRVRRAGRVVRAVEDLVAVNVEEFYEREELEEIGIDADTGKGAAMGVEE
ncbi:MAG: PilZ domain-containing protein [Rhodospirillales bacterium]